MKASDRVQILVASSDAEACKALGKVLVEFDLEPFYCSTVSETLTILAKKTIGLVICEASLADGHFRHVLTAVQVLRSNIRVIVTLRLANITEYVQAMEYGAFDVIAYPYHPAEVKQTLEKARLETLRLTEHSPGS